MLKNIIANIVGRFWGILSNFLFIPIYIKILGIESYSVVSFSLIFIGLMSVMDASLTGTLSREFSKNTEPPVNKKSVLNTLEICYAILVSIVLVLVLTLAEPIAKNWISLSTLDVSYVASALQIFGIAMLFQFLGNFYLGGLLGLQKQVKANVYQVIWGICRNGLVIVVIYYSPSLISFFLWQAVITFIYVILVRRTLLKTIGRESNQLSSAFLFDKKLLRSLSKFAVGMLVISLVAAINTQLDRIAISKLLPISELGFYNIALTLPQALIVLVNPLSIALLPKFTEMYTSGQEVKAVSIFKISFQLVSIIIFAIAAVFVVYGNEILYVWTGNQDLADSSSDYILYSTLGTAFLAMQIIPFNIAIANGYTKVNNILGLASLLVSIPGYWLSVKYYGPFGATVTWFIIQSIATPILIYHIGKKFLQSLSFFDLYFKKTVLTALLALSIVYLVSLSVPIMESRYYSAAFLAILILFTMLLLSVILIPLKKIRSMKSMLYKK